MLVDLLAGITSPQQLFNKSEKYDGVILPVVVLLYNGIFFQTD